MNSLNSVNSVAKGTRDFGPRDMVVRKGLINKMEQIFIRYGGQPVETPVVEKISTVHKLYGDEFNKLVYELDKSRTEQLILRYDHTLPFARYVVSNHINAFKRYTIGKVYRRDNPQVSKGRYREFYQCDFDIVGTDYDQNIQEFEILSLIKDVLTTIIGENKFKIQINSRQILCAILKSCSVPEQCISLIDRVDKMTQLEFNNELIKSGVNQDSVNKLLNCLDQMKEFTCSEQVVDFVEQIQDLDVNLDQIEGLVNSSLGSVLFFNPFLARGMEYYTGLTYEAIVINSNISNTLNTVAAGGRYDTLVEKLGGEHTPMIGVSFGLDRIVDVLNMGYSITNLNNTQNRNVNGHPDIYVASVGKSDIYDLSKERIKLCTELRKCFHVETNYHNEPTMRYQLNQMFKQNIRFMIIIGEKELENNTVQIKDIINKTQTELSRTSTLCLFIHDKLYS